MRFELNHLDSYDDEALLAELRRVATLVPGPKLTRTAFQVHSKVSASTIGRRFGGWGKALERAGLEARYENAYLGRTEDEILSAMRAVAKILGQSQLTRQEFEAHSGIGTRPYLRLFGSWKKALIAAGLEPTPLGRRYTDEECFENMLMVWTEYGRPPQHDEMNDPPSRVGSKAYVRRWGTWRKALAAFVDQVNRPAVPVVKTQPAAVEKQKKTESPTTSRGPRDIPLALRYFILKRDSFRCVRCGRSPSTEHGLVLHVDHIDPWAKGGSTIAANLRTLCIHCNLGKGDKLETEI